MKEPSRIPAVTFGESVWLAFPAATTILALVMLLSGPNVMELFVRQVPPDLPVHTPLPDLCTVFPGGAAAGLTLKPEPGLRELDRSKAGCSFEVAGSTKQNTRSVRLEVLRPEPLYGEENEAGELKEAKRHFVQDPTRSTPDTASDPLPGLGDEAKIAADPGKYDRSATVRVRDGLLVLRVDYRVSELRDGGPATPIETVRETARRLAAELLKLLPPKGA